MSSRNHQIDVRTVAYMIRNFCKPRFHIEFLMCHRVWRFRYIERKFNCKTKKCQKIWQIFFFVYNNIVKLKKWRFIPYEKTHGNKNQKLWSITQQIKKSSGWLLQRTRHFQKIRNFKETETHNGKNVESAIRNFPTFTWWIKKSWLKMQ